MSPVVVHIPPDAAWCPVLRAFMMLNSGKGPCPWFVLILGDGVSHFTVFFMLVLGACRYPLSG